MKVNFKGKDSEATLVVNDYSGFFVSITAPVNGKRLMNISSDLGLLRVSVGDLETAQSIKEQLVKLHEDKSSEEVTIEVDQVAL